MTTSADTATLPVLQALKPSPRMPVLFIGHGSPMNAIEDNAWCRSWQTLGAELLAREAKPQLILCISAHWLTRGGWQITDMAKPKTIHDFGGFPQALFDQQYSAPGAPTVASALARDLKSPTEAQYLSATPKRKSMHPVLNIDERTVQEFCESHSIRKLALFGSQIKGTAGPDSDIDLLVDFEPDCVPGLLGMAAMEDELSSLLGGRKVDLRTARDLSRHFRDDIVRTAQVQYAG